MSEAELTGKAAAYRTLKAKIKTLEEETERLKSEMIARMDELGAEKLKAGEYTLHYTAYESSRLDSKKLQKEIPEVADRYTVKSTSLRFAIT